MKQIRYNVFETNSSSTHAINISREGILPPVKCDEAIYLSGDEFGWAWDRFNDWETKANYMAQSITSCPWNGDPYITDQGKFDMLREVIMEQTGAPEVIISANGYIDHQSSDIANDAWKDKDTLRDFIFNPKSYLFTGNDNSEPPLNFYDPPGTKFTHQVRLVGIDYNTPLKLKSIPSKEELQTALITLWHSFCCETRDYRSPKYDDDKVLPNYDIYGDGVWSEIDEGHFIVGFHRYNEDTGYEKLSERKVQFKLEEL